MLATRAPAPNPSTRPISRAFQSRSKQARAPTINDDAATAPHSSASSTARAYARRRALKPKGVNRASGRAQVSERVVTRLSKRFPTSTRRPVILEIQRHCPSGTCGNPLRDWIPVRAAARRYWLAQSVANRRSSAAIIRSRSRHSSSLARISRRNWLMASASVLVDSPFNFRVCLTISAAEPAPADPPERRGSMPPVANRTPASRRSRKAQSELPRQNRNRG